jgi:hypothetical protein
VVDILKRLIHKGQVHAEKLIARYLIAALAFPLARDSNHFPSSTKVISNADVS